MKYNKGGSQEGYSILKYGSTINGMHSRRSSDIDLTIVINDYRLHHDRILEDVMKALKKYQSYEGRYKFQKNMPRLDKPGWILRFYDT